MTITQTVGTVKTALTVNKIGDDIKRGFQDLGERLKDFGHDVKVKTDEFGKKMGDGMKRFGEKVKETFNRMKIKKEKKVDYDDIKPVVPPGYRG